MQGTEYIAVIATNLGQLVAFGAGAGGGFSAVKWFIEFATKRQDARSARLDADTRFVIDNLRTEFTRVSDRLSKAEDHILDLREKLNQCEAKHGKAEAEVARLSVLVEMHTAKQEELR